MMRKVGIVEARQKLKTLLHEVADGRQIVVLRRGKEIARIVPPVPRRRRRLPPLGAFRAAVRVAGPPLSREVIHARRAARY